jgi:hypothetical protein
LGEGQTQRGKAEGGGQNDERSTPRPWEELLRNSGRRTRFLSFLLIFFEKETTIEYMSQWHTYFWYFYFSPRGFGVGGGV